MIIISVSYSYSWSSTMSTTSATHSSCPANSGPVTAGSRLGRTSIKCFHRFLKIHFFKQVVPGDIRRDDLLVKVKVIVHPPNGLQYAGIIWSKFESDQLVRPNQIHDDTHDICQKNIARIANAVQVTICLLVCTSVY